MKSNEPSLRSTIWGRYSIHDGQVRLHVIAHDLAQFVGMLGQQGAVRRVGGRIEDQYINSTEGCQRVGGKFRHALLLRYIKCKLAYFDSFCLQ
jgi:hypothetical protein